MKKAIALSHELVPKHEILGDGERQKLLQTLSVSQLPKIKVSDPALGGFEAKIGDIIKITRKDVTAENTYYRIVISD